MAVSEVAICNAALSKLGAGSITALTENVKNAREMSLRYASVRRAELRRRRWKFSIARASLAALASAPNADYARQFQLPNDYLRLIEGGDIASFADLSDYRTANGRALYSIEGRLLLTSLGAPLKIRYIGDVTDTSLFDPAFDESFASRLAYECCEAITQSTTKQDQCLRDYRMSILEGARANAIETPATDPADSEWVLARMG